MTLYIFSGDESLTEAIRQVIQKAIARRRREQEFQSQLATPTNHAQVDKLDRSKVEGETGPYKVDLNKSEELDLRKIDDSKELDNSLKSTMLNGKENGTANPRIKSVTKMAPKTLINQMSLKRSPILCNLNSLAQTKGLI